MGSLTDLIASLRHTGTKRILLIPFEDRTLRPCIETSLEHCEIEEWTKADLTGLSPLQFVKKLRSHRWDAVIASVYQSAVKRSRSGVGLLLACTNAPVRWLRVDEKEWYYASTQDMLFLLLPRLIAASVLGMAMVAFQYVLILMLQRQHRAAKRTLSSSLQGATMLFLRTDLAGALKAGGSISHIKGMMRAFLNAGFRVIYVADSFIDVLPQEVIQCPLPPIALLDVLDEFQLIAYNIQLFQHLSRIERKFSPLLVYQRHSIFNVAGGLFAQRFRIPFVLEANASEVWVKKHWSRLFFEDLARRCESRALYLADRVAVISKGVEEQLAPCGLESTKVLLNPNGVDPEEFHPSIDGNEIRAKWNLKGTLVVGFIGTFTRWHGVETLFEAAVRVVEHNSGVRFLLIGDGDLRSTLQHRAEELQMTDRLIFTGLIPHAEAPRYLAACDILVSPHLGFEGKQKFFGSPTKLFEYMAMGKPIIASKLEQIGEIIVDGVNGLHIEPGNAEQLRECIILLANNENLRKRLGTQARSDVIDRYTWDRNVQRILKSL